MLKSTKVKIDLLTDYDQILFIEQNIRGGMSYINQRYCSAGTEVHSINGDIQEHTAEILYTDGK